MNDTFDNFTFSHITTNIEKTDLPQEKTNEISFDDSLFLNSQEFSVLRNAETEIEKIEKNTSIFDGFLNSESFTTTQNNTSCDLFEKNSSLVENFLDSSVNVTDRTPQETPKHGNEENDTSQDDLFDEADPHILKLSSWGLPDSILEKYTSRKIATMFPWQAECLKNPRVLKQHANLVYSAPTSAGKTLVAEILAIKTVLERSKKVIFILPFVSVVREKMFYFQDIFSGSGVRVEGFMGSYNPPGGFKSVHFAVCTIEKANSLINHFLQEGTLSEIGAVVIDEMHLLGEPNRGYILELLLTKLKYVSLKDSTVDVQIIGMSATLPNLQTLSKWLDAELYVTNFRPIPLHELASVAGDIYDSNFKLVRKIAPLPDLDTDTDHILQLCLETIKDNCSVLIFCPTKNWCENLAQQISAAFCKLGRGTSQIGVDLRSQLNSERICELLEQLKRCPVGLDPVLCRTASFGVAFHHAGLTLDERDIVEGAFRGGVVRVLVATSTLSSGVNLPARRVIIRTPVFHGKALDALVYRQMMGRAGRMGKDACGESILVCQKHEEKHARGLMTEALRPVESCLEGDGKLKRAILEVVASGVASSPEDVELFAGCTLLAQSGSDNPIADALDFLVKNEFVRLVELEKYVATGLGKACLSASMPPEDGLALFTELERARQCFVLETELHLIYLVTPYSACHQWGNVDWMFYLNLWEKLPPSMKKVGGLVGVRESYIVSATRGKPQTNTSKLYHTYMVHKRFFVALALQDLVNETPLSDVCAKFSCNRGMLQTLQLTAATFAGMVTSFSKQLGWSSVEILISQFQDRLHFGVSRDLLDLMKLPILNGRCARALYNAGLETLVQIANCDANTIETVLRKVVPFESEKLRDGETELAMKERHKLKNIWIVGKEGLTEKEAAELLLTSAREYLRMEMGLKEAKWDTKDTCSHSSDESLFENSLILDVTRVSLSSTGDFVATSQDESFFTPKTPRKRLRRGKENVQVGESPMKKSRTEEEVSEFEIVNVCNSESVFKSFCNEARSQEVVSVAVGCSEVEENKRTIGLTPAEQRKDKFIDGNRKVEGFAISWDGHTSYYLCLSKMADCIPFVRSLLGKQELSLRMYDSKEHIKVLKKCCAVDVLAHVEDPKIADWLLEPDGREKTLLSMVTSPRSPQHILNDILGLPLLPDVLQSVSTLRNHQKRRQPLSRPPQRCRPKTPLLRGSSARLPPHHIPQTTPHFKPRRSLQYYFNPSRTQN